LLFNHEYAGIVKTLEIISHVDISKAFFILLFMYHSENFQKCSVCLRLLLFLAYSFWGREFAQTFETSKINTALLSHQWSKACSQSTMPGDRNSTHCVSFTFAWGYCRLLLKNFCNFWIY